MHLTINGILQSAECYLSFNHLAELTKGREDANVCQGNMYIIQEGGFENIMYENGEAKINKSHSKFLPHQGEEYLDFPIITSRKL